MPFVVKQPGEEIADEKRGYSVVLYGPPLVGKTTTLDDNPNWRVCVIDLDHNTGVIEESPNVTIIGIDSIEEYFSVKQGVMDGVWNYPGGTLKMNFDMYALDSLTTFEEKIKQYVSGTYAPNRRREIQTKFGAQSDWGDLQDIEIKEVRDWQAMTKRAKNPINVLWIGHDMNVTNEMGQAIATQLMLQGKYAAPRIGSAVDAMFYMFKRPDPDPVKAGKGIVHRGLYTIDTGIIRADARMAIRRRGELPPVIWSPKWSKIFPILGYKK